MRAVLTRVKSASVAIGGEVVGKIGQGFLILLGVGPEDTEKECRYLAEKGYAIEAERLLPDEHRVYQVIACRYVGAPASSLSALWELVGQGNKESPHLPLLLAKIKKQYSDIVKGKQSAGQDTAWEEALLKEVEEYETH